MDKHTVKNPLLLTWNGSEYKVSKPEQGTQALVSLQIAKDLKEALAKFINNGQKVPSKEDLNNGVKAYNKSLG